MDKQQRSKEELEFELAKLQGQIAGEKAARAVEKMFGEDRKHNKATVGDGTRLGCGCLMVPIVIFVVLYLIGELLMLIGVM